MLEKIGDPTSVRSRRGDIPIYHRYTLGVAGERFFRAMRDQGQLLASQCPGCNQRFLPPKMYCEACFQETRDWSSVEGPGYVKTYTTLHRSLEDEPLESPVVVALIAWEGVRGGLLHRLEGIDPAAVKVGLEVEPQWAGERTGSLEDIRGFHPV